MRVLGGGRLTERKWSRLLRNRKALGAVSLTLADVTAKAIGFIFTPYLANRMGAAGFGSLSLYLSASELLVFLLVLGGPALVAADYVRNGYTSARRLRAATLRLSLWIAGGLLVLSTALSIFAPSVIPLSVGALVVAVSYVQALNSLELAYYRGAQEYRYAIAGQFAFAASNVILTVLAFEFHSPSATNRLLSVALAGGLVQLVYALELRRRSYDRASTQTTRANTSLIISFGLSVSVHVVSAWVRASVDRFFVSAFVGLAAAGIYSVALTIAMVPAVFFAVVSQQLQPFLYRKLKDCDYSGFRKIQTLYVGLVILLVPVYYLLLRALFDLAFDREFDAAKPLLPVLLAGSSAQCIYYVFSHASFYERRGGLISMVTGGALAVHLMGLGALALTGVVTTYRVALVFFVSSAVATVAMAFVSHRTVRKLITDARIQSSMEH